ncbi:MAG TPA: guanylate kinase [Mariprofundaceae bacterium]|nr:guanylate kinase [Mariprofundaceae bacterium]
MKQGALYIVSGPSGSGKTTLCAALLERTPDLGLSTSCTTRPPRPGEEHGREYYFLDDATFEAQRAAGDFLECAHVHGHWYGTRAADVESMLEQGRDVLLEIDWQGAAQVAARIAEACRIFILPPSIEALESRLRSRGQDDESVIARRIAAAREELAHADEAEYRIVNADFDDALRDLLAVYRAHRLRLQHYHP